MKKLLLHFLLALVCRGSLLAQCGSGSYTVTSNLTITGSCKITGDLTLLNGATLNVDLTGAAPDTFVVQGNILLQGNAVLWVHAAPGSSGDQFIVSNTYNNQRTITTKDSSRVQLEFIEFRTQEGNLANGASIYMNYNASGKSILYVNTSWLDNQKAWMLFNMKNKSTLMGYAPKHLPTEIYMQDTVQVALHGTATDVGLWLNFESITDTLNLPADQTQPYSWKIGRGSGGLSTPWYLELDTVNPGLGAEIFPSSKMTVNGTGLPATGELKTAMMFSNGTDTLKNLNAGLQNGTVTDGLNGSVKFNNVNLGPIAWQLYALVNENLVVTKCVVNEIGIAGPSQVVVDSSVLQLAVLAAVGVGGSKMTIKNSEIWNQAITASNSGTIVLTNCNVTGSAFSTTDPLSLIIVNGGCFFQNPAGCTPATMVNITTGHPYCNPFIPAGFPKILTPTAVTLNNVNTTCATYLETQSAQGISFLAYPNPFSDELRLETSPPLENANLTLYNSMGQAVNYIKNSSGSHVTLLRDKLPSGYYFICLSQGGKVIATKQVMIMD